MFNDDRYHIRMPSDLKRMLIQLVKKSEGKYDTVSHFLKVAAIKHAKEEGFDYNKWR